MSDHLSYQSNPETRGTAPVQFFEADSGAPPAGTKATPRPAGRPRELPPGGPASAAFQLFECEGTAGARGGTATPQSGSRGGADE
jgi:hypothetical protein